MSDESSTSGIARSVIAESNSTPASDPVTTLDHNRAFADAAPEAALRELFHLTGGETDITRLAASAAIQRTDARPVVRTAEGNLRRQHDANGSMTSQYAREYADLAGDGGLNPEDEDTQRNSQSMAVHQFVRDAFRAGTGFDAPVTEASPDDAMRIGTDEFHQSADDLIDLMIKHSREAK